MFLSDTLYSRFACSDIQPVSRSEALVAVTSYRGARDLLSRSGAIFSPKNVRTGFLNELDWIFHKHKSTLRLS